MQIRKKRQFVRRRKMIWTLVLGMLLSFLVGYLSGYNRLRKKYEIIKDIESIKLKERKKKKRFENPLKKVFW